MHPEDRIIGSPGNGAHAGIEIGPRAAAIGGKYSDPHMHVAVQSAIEATAESARHAALTGEQARLAQMRTGIKRRFAVDRIASIDVAPRLRRAQTSQGSQAAAWRAASAAGLSAR